MNEELLFFIVEHDKVMRKIIANFLRQMVHDDVIPPYLELYDASNGEEALNLFKIMFKTAAETSSTYRDEPITPLPGRQGKAIAISDVEMEPIGGRELLQVCMDDKILRDMSFVMMTQNPDLGLVSDLGEIYQKIIAGHSQDATLWFNRAVNLAAWGRKDNNNSMLREAIDHFRVALKLRPDYLEADRAIQQLKFDIKAGMKGV